MSHGDGIKRYSFEEAFSNRFDLRGSEFVSRLTTREWEQVKKLRLGEHLTLREGMDQIVITRTD